MQYTVRKFFFQKALHTVSSILIVYSAVSFSPSAYSEAFTEVGDESLRYYLTVLDAHPNIRLPLTTWPLAWKGIDQSLLSVRSDLLSEREQRAYRYVKQASEQAKKKVQHSSRATVANSPAALSGFEADYRERYELSTALAWNQPLYSINQKPRFIENITGRFEFTFADDAIDNKPVRLDGSYIAAQTKNWSFGYGAIDRWWGPGWQSSLILSHAARPTDGFFIRRDSSTASTWPVFSWLGPWQFTLIANTFEEERHIPNARFLASRLAFKPFSFLELAAFRTAQWGGDGRTENFDVLTNLILGRDNNGSGGIDAKAEDEPGNQLAGIDLNINVSAFDASHQFYTQVAGEDEARGLPSRTIFLVGSSHQFSTGNIDHHLTLEYADTLAAGGAKARANYAYEHLVIYHSGYRHYGRPLGASVDNDTRALTLLGNHWLPLNYQFSWKLMKADINRDGGSLNREGAGSVWGDDRVDQLLGQVSLNKQFSTPWKTMNANNVTLGLGIFYFRNDMQLESQTINSGGVLTMKYKH